MTNSSASRPASSRRRLSLAAPLLLASACVGASTCIHTRTSALAQGSNGLPLRLPAPTTRAAATTPRLEQLKVKNRKYPTFAAFREMTEIYIQLGRYSDAATALRAQAALYRRKGLFDASIIQARRAQRYETQVHFFVERPLREDE